MWNAFTPAACPSAGLPALGDVDPRCLSFPAILWLMWALVPAANEGVGWISSLPSGDIVARSSSVLQKGKEEIPQSFLIWSKERQRKAGSAKWYSRRPGQLLGPGWSPRCLSLCEHLQRRTHLDPLLCLTIVKAGWEVVGEVWSGQKMRALIYLVVICRLSKAATEISPADYPSRNLSAIRVQGSEKNGRAGD